MEFFKGGFLMLVKFDDVFNKQNQMQIIAPKMLLDYLNSIAPTGTKYKFTSDGVFILEPIFGENEYTIEGLTIENDLELRNKLGSEYSTENIIKYSYNTQIPIRFKTMHNDKISINGTKITLDKTIIDPKKRQRYVKGSARFFLIPSSFPPPHKITLGNGEISRDIILERIPNDSLHEISFRSISEEYFVFRNDYNEKTRSLKFNFTVNLSKATRIIDYVEVFSLYKAFFDGTIQINGVRIGELKYKKSKNNFTEGVLQFWTKVLEIESKLSLNFNPQNHRVTNKDFRTVEELYQTMVRKEPIRLSSKIESFSLVKI